jgi:spermidine synthase
VVLLAAVTVATLPFTTRPVFDLATSAFVDLSAGAFIASFIGALLMFSVPITCLGAVAPWAIRLAVTDVEHAGTVAGRLYALSTVGSILGTFLPVLVLIPTIGTRRTLLLSAILLAVAAALVLPRKSLAVPVGMLVLMVIPVGQIKDGQGDRVLFEGESPYQFVQVVEQDDGDRVLHLNEGWAVHSILPARGVLTNGYWDSFLALPLLNGAPGGRMAVIGNAGGTVSNLFAAGWPATRIDGVEIDPMVTDVGRRYLDMGQNPNLDVHTADGRFWLRGTDARFDEVVIDAYRQPYIPFHLATREFFQLVASRLTPHGVVAINVGTPPGLTEAVDRIGATMRAVFPVVQVSRYDEFNSVLIAYRDPADGATARDRLGSAAGLAAPVAARLARTIVDVPAGGDVLTDDLAPLERITDTSLLEYLRQGAPGS